MNSTAADEVRSDGLVWLAAGLSLIAGIVHWVVSPGYLSQWWGYGYFFIVAGVCQIAFALAIFVQPLMYPSTGSTDSRPPAVMRAVYLSGVLGNAAIIALYIVTRTIGIPFVGPAANVVLPLTPISVATTLAELILVIVLLRLARQSVLRPQEAHQAQTPIVE